MIELDFIFLNLLNLAHDPVSNFLAVRRLARMEDDEKSASQKWDQRPSGRSLTNPTGRNFKNFAVVFPGLNKHGFKKPE